MKFVNLQQNQSKAMTASKQAACFDIAKPKPDLSNSS